MKRKVSVIIPARNEETRVFKTVHSAAMIPEVTEILVINDGSKDQTVIKATEAGAKVISLPFSLGKGGALNKGIHQVDGDIIVLLDADLGTSAYNARHLILPVLEKKADMTIAIFPKANCKGGFGLVKGLARTGIWFYTGLKVHAPLSGQRALTREVLEAVLPFAPGFGIEVSLTIKAVRAGFKVVEIPVQMSHAETGRNLKSFLHRGKQFWHVTKVLAENLVGNK